MRTARASHSNICILDERHREQFALLFLMVGEVLTKRATLVRQIIRAD
jgi:hypothetical protein